MDNFSIDIISQGDISEAIKIAFRNYKAIGYVVDKEKGLVFLWNDTGVKFNPFPFKMDAEGAAEFAGRWLSEIEYGKQPDHDGDNKKGWRVYATDWGGVGGFNYSICAVQPRWAMYGK